MRSERLQKSQQFCLTEAAGLSGHESLTCYRGQGQTLLVEEEKVGYEDVPVSEEKLKMPTFIAGGALAGGPSGEGDGLSLL